MGGEKLVQQLHGIHGQGSPPHGRGKDLGEQPVKKKERITPAWAGKSHVLISEIFVVEDHPRMGGEKARCRSAWAASRGSPPHGRGKVPGLCEDLERVGITPAWAGKSALRCRMMLQSRDHPRMGGEKAALLNRRRTKRGSPPHGRGKASDGVERVTLNRDHPRMGGEKTLCQSIYASFQGSPPHGRGKVKAAAGHGLVMGITPAWAGKSGAYFGYPVFHGDHPRMGGEKRSETWHPYLRRGSPPHGRGKVPFFVKTDSLKRITPAWAGKRLYCVFLPVLLEDHPRMGGEKHPFP